MTRNIDLLTKVRDQIVREPERLDMDTWGEVCIGDVDLKPGVNKVELTCGTTACVAGWATQLHGDKFVVEINDCDGWEDGDRFIVGEVTARNGRRMGIGDRARALLGLTREEASLLFYLDEEDVLPALNLFIAGASLDDVDAALNGESTD